MHTNSNRWISSVSYFDNFPFRVHFIMLHFLPDINGDSCEEERSLLKRRLAASYVETERWVI